MSQPLRPFPLAPAPESALPALRGAGVARMPVALALVPHRGRIALMTEEGELFDLTPAEARLRLGPDQPVLVCHRRFALQRLGLRPSEAAGWTVYDVLELFAFLHPALAPAPTVAALREALALPTPPTEDGLAQVAALAELTQTMLERLARQPPPDMADIAALAQLMGKDRWAWAPFVLAAAGPQARAAGRADRALAVWQRLPETAHRAAPPAPAQSALEPQAIRRHLNRLVANALGPEAEPRPEQADYASGLAPAFGPRAAPPDGASDPAATLVVAEAGTGVGKTLGYLAPALLWAEQNKGAVWVSTYTRALQAQVEATLEPLIPDESQRERQVVVRKGRENYACLLTYEEAARGVWSGTAHAGLTIPTVMMARWLGATGTGDLGGTDFPGWLPEILSGPALLPLGERGAAPLDRRFADRRGECIHGACDHYDRCFVERSLRRAREAQIVIGNHALTLIQLAQAGEDAWVPTRLVFDEGHHLFDAADSAFATILSGGEAADLRRWLLGPEAAGRRGRARGLRTRLGPFLADLANPDAGESEARIEAALQAAEAAARALPGDDWGLRLQQGRPQGALEGLLAAALAQVRARATGPGDLYGAEAELFPVDPLLAAAAQTARAALTQLIQPLATLLATLRRHAEDRADTLTLDDKRRLEAVMRGLDRRLTAYLHPWAHLLDQMPPGGGGKPVPGFVDWLEATSLRDPARGVAINRHVLDPTRPLADMVSGVAHGVVVTSASLKDSNATAGEDMAATWRAAEARLGVPWWPRPATRLEVPSPFDHAGRTLIVTVQGLDARDIDQLATAFRVLFQAAGGGGLGLFTAINRLRQVHERLAPALEAAGLPLYAQHVDPLTPQTLVDLFKAEPDSCLLGTDALRDGIDVPGRALRLVAFEKVPWPRPGVLHRARREASGDARGYDLRVARAHLKQAYGRLMRRADDRGVFVLLDSRAPLRELQGAFPARVPLLRLGLAEAARTVRQFLDAPAPLPR